MAFHPPGVRPSRRLARTLSTLTISAAAALALAAPAQAAPVWISLDEDAFRLLREISPSVRPAVWESLQVAVPRAGGRGTEARTERVAIVQVDERLLDRLGARVHEKLNRCGGYFRHASRAEAEETVARMRRGAAPMAQPEATVPSYALDDGSTVGSLMPQVQESEVLATIQTLSAYQNRYYKTQVGTTAAADLASRWRALATGRTDVKVDEVTHPAWPQKSVIMTITGTEAPNEVVVIGGHLDSILLTGTRENSRAPGADDNASGIAALQEAARVLIQGGWRPKRTLQFMGYAAEEVGLLGSAAIARAYRTQGRDVVGVLQLDMTNYPGTSTDITLITDYTNAAQNDFIAALAAAYVPESRVLTSRCGYACSDHASWTSNGFAASFPFEAPLGSDNPHIHTRGDTLAKSGNSATHATRFARLALAYAIELGDDTGAGARR
jgi:bacterial leucyl aminopeptidase